MVWALSHFSTAWYHSAMNPTTRRLMLTARPSSIFRLQAQTPDWIQDLTHLAEYPSDMGRLLNKLYAHTPLPERQRLAWRIANSRYHHVVKTCDAIYLTEWLQPRFLQVVSSVQAGHLPEQRESFRRTTTSVLSTWLRNQPHLRDNFASIAGVCFYLTVPRTWPAAQLEMVLDTVVPRQFRTPQFYEKILGHAPHLTVVAAQHVQEHAHIMQLSPTQCRYAAAMPGGWFALYPQSKYAEQINGLFEVMNTLGHYDPDMLRAALNLQAPTLVQMELPENFDALASVPIGTLVSA